jgi:hypothetical protein
MPPGKAGAGSETRCRASSATAGSPTRPQRNASGSQQVAFQVGSRRLPFCRLVFSGSGETCRSSARRWGIQASVTSCVAGAEQHVEEAGAAPVRQMSYEVARACWVFG